MLAQQSVALPVGNEQARTALEDVAIMREGTGPASRFETMHAQ